MGKKGVKKGVTSFMVDPIVLLRNVGYRYLASKILQHKRIRQLIWNPVWHTKDLFWNLLFKKFFHHFITLG